MAPVHVLVVQTEIHEAAGHSIEEAVAHNLHRAIALVENLDCVSTDQKLFSHLCFG